MGGNKQTIGELNMQQGDRDVKMSRVVSNVYSCLKENIIAIQNRCLIIH